MTGRNMNVYFREETYKRIKDLVNERNLSHFINEAVEKELTKKELEKKEELRQKLIVGYQNRAKNESLKTMLKTYGEMSWSDVSIKLEENERNK